MAGAAEGHRFRTSMKGHLMDDGSPAGYDGGACPAGDTELSSMQRSVATPLRALAGSHPVPETEKRRGRRRLSQGAKPGHGGVLPGAKVTAEIANARGVPIGVDCISPARHSAFKTPIEMMHFIAQLRELSGGKPIGFKLCVGHAWEFMALCKAMLETGIHPDFIVIDGSEGGTGAAPLEFVDHVGTPLREGLVLAHNCLVGAGLRPAIRLGERPARPL
jgi:Conserved region in glutamate synthase